MKKILLAAVVCCMAAGAAAQQRMGREFEGAFKIPPLWYHPTSDSTVEVVPCQADCVPLPLHVVVPEEVTHNGQTYKVTRIGRRAFAGFVSTIVLPETIVELGEDCGWTTATDSVRLPNSVRVLESGSVGWKYDTFYIPASVERIDANAFNWAQIKNFRVDEGNTHYRVVDGLLYTADTSELLDTPHDYAGVRDSLVLPEAVLRIGAYALQRVTQRLRTLVLPEGLREIGVGGLGNYSWEVELPASVVRLEGNPVTKRPAVPFSLTVNAANTHYRLQDGALLSADGDTLFLVQMPSWQNSYSVPEGVKVLAGSLFDGWETGLDTVRLPEGLETIGPYAFNETACQVNMPSTLKSIQYGAFAFSDIEGDLVLPASLRELGPYAFHSCKKLTSVALPDSLEVIEKCAFVVCNRLARVTFGSRLREIHPEAFLGGGPLTVSALPRTLQSVGNLALYSSLKHIEFEGTPEELGETVTMATSLRFGDGQPPLLYSGALPEVDTVYVPCGMAEVYRGAVLEGWGERFTYVEDCDGIGDPASGEGLRMVLHGRTLQVTTAEPGAVRVLDALGRTLYSGSAPATVQLPAAGVYLVHPLGGKARKVVATR